MGPDERDGLAAEVFTVASIVPGFRAVFASETRDSCIHPEMFSDRESEHLSNLTDSCPDHRDGAGPKPCEQVHAFSHSLSTAASSSEPRVCQKNRSTLGRA